MSRRSGSRVNRPRANHRTVAAACLAAAWLVLALGAAGSRAQTVPAETQVPIFFKLLTYDRTLWEEPREQLRIGVLHRQGDAASQANLAGVAAALTAAADKTINGVDFDFTTLTWSDPAELEARLAATDVDVLYVTAGHRDVLGAVTGATRARGILSLAARSEDVARGLSVGLGLQDERPRPLVNLVALAAEGHQLEARVLTLCRVVQR